MDVEGLAAVVRDAERLLCADTDAIGSVCGDVVGADVADALTGGTRHVGLEAGMAEEWVMGLVDATMGLRTRVMEEATVREGRGG